MMAAQRRMVLKALLFNTAKFMTKCLLLVKCGTATSWWRVLVRNGSVASLLLTTTISLEEHLTLPNEFFKGLHASRGLTIRWSGEGDPITSPETSIASLVTASKSANTGT